ncbi:MULTISPECIES: nitroreductase family protein [unclassified Streptomyces]|uniref:Acg family FMN-binding oxidoreductase n=1 Tax=unclassified Streptomyces TaxID=2593676 RepID=UPI002030CD70|nr:MULTISPECIES: nitroreductase family protein [unclassified Streptomyces]MCM1972942.1 nitroreductase family protein [Streptomyces sp. G1]MCX5129344.1 nitroreductase family protein [Streptomyces sp. NBC_00347]
MTATHLDPDTVIRLVGDAVTAPSMHNAQPWKFVFRVGSATFALYGDPERAMTRTDPNHRGLHLGCAAALFNLRVSAAWIGLPVRVQLLPDAAEPWLLATVTIDETTGADHELASLHDAVRRRHTSRYPFSEEPVPTALLDSLWAAAHLEGCRLTVPDTWHIDTVLGLVRDAEHREEIDPLVQAETASWTSPMHSSAGPRPDGIPAAAFGPKASGGPTPVRDFGWAKPIPNRGWAVFEKRPQLALLSTSGDTQVDWLRAGQAMERVLLQATADGLATSMTSHPLEWPELRWTLRDPVAAMGHVQMVFRLGYGPAGSDTPRRPVTEVLEIRE